MADPFVAEIRIFGFNFAPKGWAMCNGQLIPISQNTALFSLLGTIYGGNGYSNFALPNLSGRTSLHFGRGPGLSDRDQGETGGQETVNLLPSETPSHTHQLWASASENNTGNPENNAWGVSELGDSYRDAGSGSMGANALAITGGGMPHNNMQPYLTLNFCIALQGVYPPRP